LERLVSHKHSSLLRTFVNYGRKKFYNIGPWSGDSIRGRSKSDRIDKLSRPSGLEESSNVSILYLPASQASPPAGKQASQSCLPASWQGLSRPSGLEESSKVSILYLPASQASPPAGKQASQPASHACPPAGKAFRGRRVWKKVQASVLFICPPASRQASQPCLPNPVKFAEYLFCLMPRCRYDTSSS
jgi:hypothetical protein